MRRRRGSTGTQVQQREQTHRFGQLSVWPKASAYEANDDWSEAVMTDQVENAARRVISSPPFQMIAVHNLQSDIVHARGFDCVSDFSAIGTHGYSKVWSLNKQIEESAEGAAVQAFNMKVDVDNCFNAIRW